MIDLKECPFMNDFFQKLTDDDIKDFCRQAWEKSPKPNELTLDSVILATLIENQFDWKKQSSANESIFIKVKSIISSVTCLPFESIEAYYSAPKEISFMHRGDKFFQIRVKQTESLYIINSDGIKSGDVLDPDKFPGLYKRFMKDEASLNTHFIIPESEENI